MNITHNHGPVSHTHAHGDFPHSHAIKSPCERPECFGSQAHNIHASAPGTSVKPIKVPELV